MPESLAGQKRPREDVANAAAGEAAHDRAAKRRATPPAFLTGAVRAKLIQGYKKRLVQALAAGGWEAALKLFEECVAKAHADGTQENLTPQLPFVLYSEALELIPGAQLPELFDFMSTERVLELAWGIPTHDRGMNGQLLLPLLTAAKASERLGPAAQGRARLLISKAVCMRQELMTYSKTAALRYNKALLYSKDFETPDSCAKAVHEALRTHHKVPLPEADKTAADIAALCALLHQASDRHNHDTCIELANDAEPLFKRLLETLKNSASAAKTFGSVDGDAPTAATHALPRLPTGVWDAVSLQDPLYRIEVLLMMETFLGYLLNRLCEELGAEWNPREGRMEDQEAETGVKMVKGMLQAVSKVLSTHLGTSTSRAAEAIGSERLRELVWTAWRKQPLGCRGRSIDGVENAIKDAAARVVYTTAEAAGKATGEVTKPYRDGSLWVAPAADRARTNAVTLPNPPKITADATHKFFGKRPHYGNAGANWRFWKTLTATMSREYLDAPTPPTPAPLPPFHPPKELVPSAHKYEKTSVGLWRCGRLLAELDMAFALEDHSYYYCDRETFATYVKRKAEAAPAPAAAAEAAPAS